MPSSTLNTAARPRAGLGRVFVVTLSLIALPLASAGCLWTAGVEGEVVYGYPVAHVDVLPANIYAYPSAYYRGRHAYLVGDSWYYNSPEGWVIFRSEPPELAEMRVEILRRPPASYADRPSQPRYYEQRPGYYDYRPPPPPPPPPQEPIERGRRYYPN